MTRLTPTQAEAYQAFTALWEKYDISRPRAFQIFKELFGYEEIPYFMNLDVPTAERITRELQPKRLLKTLSYAGQKTGVCQICGRELTDEESIVKGVGPVCEQKLDVSTLEDL